MPGLRGVGKTTIIYQLFSYLLNEKQIPKNRILYLNLENLKDVPNFNIKEYIDVFLKDVNEAYPTVKNQVFIFVDESQYSKNWASLGKIIFDEDKNVFMIFTGSDALNLEYNNDSARRSLKKEIYPLNEYLDNIINAVDMQKIRNAGLRVALDPMYGVSEIPLKTLLLTARCDVETIHDRHDTLFGGKLPSPSASTLRGLMTRVIDYGFDIGIATDGDADRIGVIDDTGRFLHPNDILVLLYYYLVKYKGWHGAVVRNVATTHMLDKVANKFGETCYEVPVGFKYISAKMTEENAVIGGESSGGLTVRGHINGKDGIYAAMLLIEMIAVTGRKLSEIYKDIEAECGAIYMEERDYKFTKEKKEEIHKILMEDKQIPELPYKIQHVSYMDGSKVYFENGGWVIGRFSGTEPLIRIFCEMPTKEQAIEVCEIYEKFLGLK